MTSKAPKLNAPRRRHAADKATIKRLRRLLEETRNERDQLHALLVQQQSPKIPPPPSPPPPTSTLAIILAAPSLEAVVRTRSLAAIPAGTTIRWNRKPTVTEKELWEVCTSEIAARSLLGQTMGLPPRGPAPRIRPATINTWGCWLSQARAQIHGGHCQMAPLFPRKGSRAPNGSGPVTVRRNVQLLHRLAVRAWGDWLSIKRMLELKQEVSHLCHKPNCFNLDHLVVESHHDNMQRRECDRFGCCGCGLAARCLL